MNVIVNESYEASTYFLQGIDTPAGYLIARILVLCIALFVVGFYGYVKKKEKSKK